MRRLTAIGMIVIAAMSVRADCAKNIAIQGEITRVKLPVVRGAAELVLRNITFDRHPGTQFHVFLERTDDRTKRVRVGTLSFYVSTKGRTTTSRTFDVTDELRELAPSRDVNVVFEATSGRGKSKLMVGEIELRVKGKE